MNQWLIRREEPDLEVLEESALFMAQATIQDAINEAGLSRADLAKRMNCPRSFITRMMSGRHNLTVKTMARAMLACGFEVGFKRTPIIWNWMPHESSLGQHTEVVPAHAGATPVLCALAAI